MPAGATQQVTFVTGNLNKLRELQSMSQEYLQLDHAELDLVEIQGLDPVEVTAAKAKEAYAQLQRPVLVEDTSIVFRALNGLPGPLCKWFLSAVGVEGLLRMLSGFEDRSAYALCLICLYRGPSHEPIFFEGRCDGRIATAPRGTCGFGWDSIFEADEGGGRTFAELTMEEKNAFSHRSRALHALRAHFHGGTPCGSRADGGR